MYVILLTIFQFIPCTNPKMCGHGVVENTIHAFYEFSQNNWIWILAILLIMWTALFIIVGIITVDILLFSGAASRYVERKDGY